MGKAPAFQFYANDFMDATRMWDAFACGLYIRLLCIQWTHGSLPDDQRRLAMGAGCELGELQRHWHLIEPKIPLCEDGTRKNPRLEQVRSRQLEVSAKRSGAAEARWEAHANASANGHAKPMQRKVKVEGERESGKGSAKEHEPDPQFVAFWSAYPVKKSKGDAERAWSKLTATERPLCLPAITAQVRAMHFQGSDGNSYVPHPSTWLNGRRWEDEISKAPPPITKHTELTAVEAKHQLEAIRAQHGIAPGGFIESHLVPAHISKAMQRG